MNDDKYDVPELSKEMLEKILDKGNHNRIKGRVPFLESRQDLRKMERQILERIDLIKETSLRLSLFKMFSTPVFDIFGPSSTSYHHAYPGGNMEHTLEVYVISVHMAESIRDSRISEMIDWDVLRAGALLHDIGKEYIFDGETGKYEYTGTMEYLNHIANGIQIVTKHIKSKKLEEILHIIASHHGRLEWGSPVEPKTVEAWIVHLADSFSAKVMG